ncbi:uncharacterized protein BCR38DRAFT_152108 [Pseudomassariella vexata]|uniref:Myb-like domain-containing protein n=1 Tax=Pseudomassariella vexata TaxID=1141098 RepID=A0A1Y2E6T3_9PEZI|nr:uncharacterized protein BCR38DRAFT_152108 [Pseudomassariella vexata]ORY67147.1 hypothetical protein BCR38DRAFT_152108 [Pseudomassariella vexata]
MEGVPSINWDKFAKANKYNSPTVAKNRFYNIKKRLGIMRGGKADGSSSTCKAAKVTKPQSTRGRLPKTSQAKKGNEVEDEDEADDDESELYDFSLSYKKKKQQKQEFEDDEDAEAQLLLEACAA